MSNKKVNEAILVIVTGFIILYFIYDNVILLYVSLGAGLAGVIVKPLARLIAWIWFKIGEILGLIVPKIVLFAIFYLLIVPIGFLHNIFNKDKLSIKTSLDSMWIKRDHLFQSKDFKNIF